MDVKRYDSMGFENEFGMWVRWPDFDALLAQRDALQGKLKVAVDALQRITREGLRRMASDVCDEALAQMDGMP